MDLELDYQLAEALDDNEYLPTIAEIEKWIKLVLEHCERLKMNQLTVRVVDQAEICYLNKTYRHKSNATNVLSFPFEAPKGVDLPLLGDIIICASIVAQEALQQHKSIEQHWAHMVIHGCLHLLDYDHIELHQAEIMETMEIKLMAQLGYTNPYVDYDTHSNSNMEVKL